MDAPENQKITAQYDFRKEMVLGALKENKVELKEIHAVIGRGEAPLREAVAAGDAVVDPHARPRRRAHVEHAAGGGGEAPGGVLGHQAHLGAVQAHARQRQGGWTAYCPPC